MQQVLAASSLLGRHKCQCARASQRARLRSWHSWPTCFVKYSGSQNLIVALEPPSIIQLAADVQHFAIGLNCHEENMMVNITRFNPLGDTLENLLRGGSVWS